MRMLITKQPGSITDHMTKVYRVHLSFSLWRETWLPAGQIEIQSGVGVAGGVARLTQCLVDKVRVALFLLLEFVLWEKRSRILSPTHPATGLLQNPPSVLSYSS